MGGRFSKFKTWHKIKNTLYCDSFCDIQQTLNKHRDSALEIYFILKRSEVN
jgi:hypothetical protein